MDHISKTKLVRQGKTNSGTPSRGSLYVLVPLELCEKLSLAKGDVMDIFCDGDRIVYSKVKS